MPSLKRKVSPPNDRPPGNRPQAKPPDSFRAARVSKRSDLKQAVIHAD